MTDPKTFYRELDALLATIRIEPSQGDLIQHVVKTLETTFADKLHIKHGRIYEQRGNEFFLTYPAEAPSEWTNSFDGNSETIQLAGKHRSYIYDQQAHNTSFFRYTLNGAPNFTAIWVHNHGKQWIIVFQLDNGWEREEVSLFLNAVRTSINYRLFTDVIGGDLRQAVEIQKSLLPKIPLNIKGYDIYGYSQPAELVGGDFYDYYDFADETFGISIGDVSGHGIPAALLVRDVVVGLRMGLAKELRLTNTLAKLNAVIQRSTYSANFVSLFVGEFSSDGLVLFANAGHPAPVLLTPNGSHSLEATGITLGFLPEINLGRSHAYMPYNSVLVMCTDGIIERGSPHDEQYGHHRLKALVQKNRHKSAKDICNMIFEDVFNFAKRASWEDDATIVVVKRLPAE